MEQQQQQSISLRDKLLMSVKHIFRIQESGRLCSLQGDISVSPSYALYETRYMHPASDDPDTGAEYKKLKAKQNSLYEEVKKFFPGDKLELLFDLVDLSMEMESLNKNYIYRQGLQDGFLLAVEMLPVEEKNKVMKKPSLVDTFDDYRKAL